MTQILPSHRNTTFLTMHVNILTFPQWEKMSMGVRQPSTSQEEIGEGEKYVWVSDYRVWTETVENEEQICKEEVLSSSTSHPLPPKVSQFLVVKNGLCSNIRHLESLLIALMLPITGYRWSWMRSQYGRRSWRWHWTHPHCYM
jgi:hypothetical protein